MKRIMLVAAMAAAVIGILAFGGCSDSTTPDNDGPGYIKLNLIDAPGDYDQVNVHIVRVEVHRSDDTEYEVAQFIATACRNEELRPVARSRVSTAGPRARCSPWAKRAWPCRTETAPGPWSPPA